MASDRASRALDMQAMGVNAFAQYMEISKEADDVHFTVAQRRWKRAIRIVLLRNSVKRVRKLLIGLGISMTKSKSTPDAIGVGQSMRGRPNASQRKMSTSFSLLPPIDSRVLPKQKNMESRKTMGSRRESKDLAPIDWHHHEERLSCPFSKLHDEIKTALVEISGIPSLKAIT